MKIWVRTNVDKDKNIEWIHELSCRPMIGDRIESLDRKHTRKICGITHSFVNQHGRDYPILIIEINF